MKLKSITLVFENCEDVTFDGKYVGDFVVDDLHQSFRRAGCNAIVKMDECDTFVIELHKKANHIMQGWSDDETLAFDRIQQFADITQIEFEITDENGENTNSYFYYTLWAGDSDYTNEAQSSVISDLGHCYIVISKDKRVKDVFDLNMINDADDMSFKFQMYDIEDCEDDEDA